MADSKQSIPPAHLLSLLGSKVFDVKNFCRACLYLKPDLVPLISIESDLPDKVCKECRDIAINAYNFKETCENSEVTLKTFIKEMKHEPFFQLDDASSVDCNEDHNYEIQLKDETLSINDDSDLESKKIKKLLSMQKKKKAKSKSKKSVAGLTGVKTEPIDDVKKITKIMNTKKDQKNVTFFEPDQLEAKSDGTGKDPYECRFCSETFHKPKALRLHIKLHHSAATALWCNDCNECFKSERDFNLHNILHSKTGNWTCSECNKKFHNRSRLRRHIERHMDYKRHKCLTCGKSFTETTALRRHARVHTGEIPERKHACHLCPNKYPDSRALQNHLLRHSGARPCVCPHCGKTFPTIRLLNSHQITHDDTKQYRCEYCGQAFRHESTLRTHERLHTGERPFVCSACGKTFRQNSNLTVHMRTHSGEKPYKCSQCDSRFASSSTLRNHVRTHTGEKLGTCPICSKKLSRHNVSAHVRTHSAGRVWACALCPRRANSQAELSHHLLTHTAAKPYECAICHLKSMSKSHLVKHIKKHQEKEAADSKDKLPKPEENPTLPDLRVADDIPYNYSEEVVIANDDEDNIEITEVPESTEVLDMTENIPAKTVNSEEDLPTHVCLTHSGINFVNKREHSVNQVAVRDTDHGVNPSVTTAAGSAIRLYQVDQSLLQIKSSTGQLTISKITSKMTTKFE